MNFLGADFAQLFRGCLVQVWYHWPRRHNIFSTAQNFTREIRLKIRVCVCKRKMIFTKTIYEIRKALVMSCGFHDVSYAFLSLKPIPLKSSPPPLLSFYDGKEINSKIKDVLCFAKFSNPARYVYANTAPFLMISCIQL